jgi:simple sugar transport system ATP-binding protein
VGSIEFVHKRLVQEREQGRAVIVFSTELDEVFALADRIAIMFKGRIIAIVPATETRENIGLYMAGLIPGGAINA